MPNPARSPAALGATLLALTLSYGSAASAPVRLPNVVYVYSDSHRWGAMSFTQTPAVKTPNLERLATESTSFNRRYVNLPLCSPDRAVLLTGRWPYQQGLIANHMVLEKRVDLRDHDRHRGTLAWAFKDAGYTTAHFGKWHLGSDAPSPFGFDRSVVWFYTNSHRKSRYSVDGEDPVEWEGISTGTATVEQALEWVARVGAGGKPFFVIVSLDLPHGPFHDAPEAMKALYPDRTALPFHPLDELRNWEDHRDYHALISSLDADVGRIAEGLDELGLSENTILIYTSDHGAMTGIEGVGYGGKRRPRDESTRVPFLVRWPDRIPAGVALDTLFSTIDVFPTLVALTGLDAALSAAGTKRAVETLDYVRGLPGVDLSKNILGASGAPEPDSVFLMHPSDMNRVGGRLGPAWRAVVTRDHTYAVTGDDEYALWDNAEEYQATNLVRDPDTLEIRSALHRMLRSWMQKGETPFIDNWFEKSPRSEVRAWNREHGLGEANDDRNVGRKAVFDLSRSEPSL